MLRGVCFAAWSSLFWQRFSSWVLFSFFPLPCLRGTPVGIFGLSWGEVHRYLPAATDRGRLCPSLSCSRREDYGSRASPFCGSPGFAILKPVFCVRNCFKVNFARSAGNKTVPGIGHSVPALMDWSFPPTPPHRHGAEHGSSAGTAHGQQEEVAAATWTPHEPASSIYLQNCSADSCLLGGSCHHLVSLLLQMCGLLGGTILEGKV